MDNREEKEDMKAAVIYGGKDVKIQDWDEPKVQAGHVKVKVAWAGICGSDLHAYNHGMGISVEPHPVSGRKVPLVLGHEFAGVVSEIGDGVSSVKVGDRVAVEPLIHSENNYYAKKGFYNLSEDFGFLGLNADGGFAQYAVAKEEKIFKLPDHMSLEEGALVEPTAVAVQAVKSSSLKIGDTVAVFGAGPIGQLTIIAAKAAGASKVFAIDLSPERLEKALEVGADVIINSGNEDPVTHILAETGAGVDVSYEAAGAQQTYTAAINVLKKRGELMVIAGFGRPIEMDVNSVLIKEAKITASLAYRHIFAEVIQLISSGKMNVKSVITKKIQLDNLVDEGLEILTTDKSQSKILVELPQD